MKFVRVKYVGESYKVWVVFDLFEVVKYKSGSWSWNRV
jgi:hypothetical protein